MSAILNTRQLTIAKPDLKIGVDGLLLLDLMYESGRRVPQNCRNPRHLSKTVSNRSTIAECGVSHPAVQHTLSQAVSSNREARLPFGMAHAFVIHEQVEARIRIPRSKQMRRTVLIIATVVSLLAVGASAQESRSEISLQGTGFFTKDSTGQGTTQRGTETGGFLIGYRYHLNRWLAAETVYGYDRNGQEYSGSAGLSRVQANVHQATGGFVVSLPTSARSRLSPYLLAEGGALVFDPTGNTFGSVAGAERQAVGVFAYGGGVDYVLIKHLSLRAEYRGLVYNAPDFGLANLNVDKVTHTAQPSAGFVFRF